MNNKQIEYLEELFQNSQEKRLEYKQRKQLDDNFDTTDNYLLGFYKGQALAFKHIIELLNKAHNDQSN